MSSFFTGGQPAITSKKEKGLRKTATMNSNGDMNGSNQSQGGGSSSTNNKGSKTRGNKAPTLAQKFLRIGTKENDSISKYRETKASNNTSKTTPSSSSTLPEQWPKNESSLESSQADSSNHSGHSQGEDDSSERVRERSPKRSSASANVLKASGNAMRTTVMAPVLAGKAVMNGAGGMLARGSSNASSAVAHAGAAMGSTVGNTVSYGGKKVVGGTKEIFKNLKTATAFVSVLQKETKRSKWEEGVHVIDNILEPEHPAFLHLTPDERKALANVKKLLISGPSGGDGIQHIPRDLIKKQKFAESAKRRPSERVSSNFILQEYAGVRSASAFLNDMDNSQSSDNSESSNASNRMEPVLEENENENETNSDSGGYLGNRRRMSRTSKRSSRMKLDYSLSTRSLLFLEEESGNDNIVSFIPVEFKMLEEEHQLAIFSMLSWESIKRWDFDIFELTRISENRPLLFMGWAILGSPYSQKAMAKHLGMDEKEVVSGGYPFMDELMIPPRKLCEYLQTIESDYRENPYHNNIHAADVLQTLHTLIQSGKEEAFLKNCPNIKLFAILLSAVVHDVDHPGKTNAFHTNMRSDLAVVYNDNSVLENWHVAHAFARMLGVDLLSTRNYQNSYKFSTVNNNENMKKSENNILCNATPEQFKIIRNSMIEAILHTDMTKHFAMVSSAKGILLQEVSEDTTWQILMFMLHMADISSQAKPGPIFKSWTQRCMDEFFAQGDEEEKMGLPISPNCDRKTTVIPESQVGFIKFVVAPAYEVLAEFIPFVQEHVMPIVHGNLEHWSAEAEKVEESI